MISIKNLYKKLDENVIFDDLNLTVNQGETLVVLGQSGCGKSVMLKHILGIMQPDSGDVVVDNININNSNQKELNQVRRKIGMVFQGGALFDSLTVAENVFFSLDQHSKMSFDEKYTIAEDCLKKVELEGILEKAPAELSGGMKKRVAIARAIAFKPEIILYDEPTTGLDPITADAIDDLIKYLNDEMHVTSVVVTHDIRSANRVADRMAMIHKGKIVAQGTPEEMRASDVEIVRRFVN